LLTMRLTRHFDWVLERKEYLAKMNNLPKHHGPWPGGGRLGRSPHLIPTKVIFYTMVLYNS